MIENEQEMVCWNFHKAENCINHDRLTKKKIFSQNNRKFVVKLKYFSFEYKHIVCEFYTEETTTHTQNINN